MKSSSYSLCCCPAGGRRDTRLLSRVSGMRSHTQCRHGRSLGGNVLDGGGSTLAAGQFIMTDAEEVIFHLGYKMSRQEKTQRWHMRLQQQLVHHHQQQQTPLPPLELSGCFPPWTSRQFITGPRGDKQVFTLTQAHTRNIHLTCMFLACGRKLETTQQTQGKNANCTHSPRIKPITLLCFD